MDVKRSRMLGNITRQGKFLQISLLLICNKLLLDYISASNHMFGRAIWDKLPECIFEYFEIATVKRGQFQNF